jgi:hypothetical protein
MNDKAPYEENKQLWDRFCRLGEMIGDGLHHEEPWITKEYRHLRMILCPPSEEEKAFMREQRKIQSALIDKQMKDLLEKRKCECGGNLKQARSGSKVAYCEKCNTRYKAKSKRSN